MIRRFAPPRGGLRFPEYKGFQGIIQRGYFVSIGQYRHGEIVIGVRSLNVCLPVQGGVQISSLARILLGLREFTHKVISASQVLEAHSYFGMLFAVNRHTECW